MNIKTAVYIGLHVNGDVTCSDSYIDCQWFIKGCRPDLHHMKKFDSVHSKASAKVG